MNLLAALLIVGTQDPKPGEALMNDLLAATKLNYAKTASGLSFELRFEHADKRIQVVYVSTSEQPVLAMRPHSIYTQVWSGKEPPSPALMKFVFSKTKKVGAFYVYKDANDTYGMRFGAHFDTSAVVGKPNPGDPAATTLKDLISFVDVVGYETKVEIEKEFGTPSL